MLGIAGGSLCASAYDFEADGIAYNIVSSENRTIEVTFHSNIGGEYRGDITIPGSVIYDGLYYRVTGVGTRAFRHCYQLKSIKLPESIENFGNFAFANCESLADINFPSSLTTIGSNAFQGCNMLTEVKFGEKVRSVDSEAFANCENLLSITLNEGLETLGNMVFQYCTNIPEIKLPKSLRILGSYPFLYCTRLMDINVASGNPLFKSIDGVLYNGDATELLCCPAGKVNVTVAPGTKSIAYISFYGNVNLETLSLPEGLQRIGMNAFFGCLRLTELDIPDSVVSIGEAAFRSCGTLKRIHLPANLLSIEKNLFRTCYVLEEVNIPQGVKYIGDEAFIYCYGLPEIEIGNSCTAIGNRAFQGCHNLAKVVLGNSVEEIGYRAFSDCADLRSFYCYAEFPPAVNLDYLTENSVYEKGTLYVIDGCEELYATTSPWSNFKNIDGALSGIESICLENSNLMGAGISGNVKAYNLQGVEIYHGDASGLSSLPKGVYIVGGRKIKI